jgi:hypothetical protein
MRGADSRNKKNPRYYIWPQSVDKGLEAYCMRMAVPSNASQFPGVAAVFSALRKLATALSRSPHRALWYSRFAGFR